MKFTGKKTCNVVPRNSDKNRVPLKMFSGKLYKTFQKTFFKQHVRTTASDLFLSLVWNEPEILDRRNLKSLMYGIFFHIFQET